MAEHEGARSAGAQIKTHFHAKRKADRKGLQSEKINTQEESAKTNVKEQVRVQRLTSSLSSLRCELSRLSRVTRLICSRHSFTLSGGFSARLVQASGQARPFRVES
eukprot:3689844-Rhodomonas_salina.2